MNFAIVLAEFSPLGVNCSLYELIMAIKKGG